MIIIPAIDLKKGKCVRLLQGRMDKETVFSDDPSAIALRWEKEGAGIIHIVDLDGAVQKQPENFDSIKKILENINIPVQVGGGIRDESTIKMYLDLGVARVIIGTEAIKNPKMVKKACRAFPDRIIVGIDARNGLVAVEGWTQTTQIRAVDLAKEFENSGVSAINFTDIHRDGMQSGPNIEETRLLAEAVSIPVVASGGVSTIEDIKNLLPLQEVGVTGVIAGRSLYAGTLSLKEAVQVLQNSCFKQI
ncbi:phosphoribosylformimino-5-aminoimidazole carboxamide ribotide isomerase [Desulfosarcina sp. BuS5]|uniref:1-(5-phosphoribosyl)-5-[(5- phosphoribosylamino)methylideneamino]imidazole-4- carboxamide isomerase n=1 Tax=Desulfosarcina sp. BuS5 TaxID=933262 RepID=UPI000487EAFB|nr:1-(5-phosphoribosyl)-5-[(5-phosphoribosylamino)methylideneamino]imidazole-4-carboxamide isomerase [Desulfosarcina sp. BuS5]WDN90623.1 phosphoribosylformimino-5-aminoimidazole carboxamide ribotide isomerase [Desulfosarcina sp. BuS5]